VCLKTHPIIKILGGEQMVIKFEERSYAEVEAVTMMRWFPEQDLGVIIISGRRVAVNKEEYDKIEQAFLWKNKSIMYEGYKKYNLVRRAKGEHTE
jgi:hypothetical protein